MFGDVPFRVARNQARNRPRREPGPRRPRALSAADAAWPCWPCWPNNGWPTDSIGRATLRAAHAGPARRRHHDRADRRARHPGISIGRCADDPFLADRSGRRHGRGGRAVGGAGAVHLAGGPAARSADSAPAARFCRRCGWPRPRWPFWRCGGRRWCAPKPGRESSTLVVLADQSRSMLVADAFGGKTRWDALRQTLADAEPPLEKLRGENLDLRLYTFDADLHPLELTDQGLDLPDDARRPANRHRRGARRSAAQRGRQAPAGRGAADRRRPAGVRPARHRAANARPGDWPTSAFRSMPAPSARRAGKARPATWRSRTWSSIKPSSSRTSFRSWPTPGSTDWSIRTCRCNCCSKSPGGKMQVVGTQDLHASQDGASLPVEFDYMPETARRIQADGAGRAAAGRNRHHEQPAEHVCHGAARRFERACIWKGRCASNRRFSAARSMPRPTSR